MRNFNDFIRVLGGIHSVLSGIASKIDLIPAGGSGGSSVNYTIDEEREIGVWTDGTTPLYEKVLKVTGAAQSTDLYIDLDESVIDLSNAWVENVIFIGSQRTCTSWYAGSGDQGRALIFNTSDHDQLYYRASGLGTGTFDAIFVLRYTKVS